MSSLLYWLWLSSIEGIGAVTASALIGHFGDPQKVHEANLYDLYSAIGTNRADISKLENKSFSTAQKIMEACSKIGCSIITLHDDAYPDRLRNIYDPPLVLYIKGEMPLVDDEPVVAVVGSRTCTSYGLRTAEKLGYELAQSGVLVSTGLARGIDSAAAKGTIRAGGRVLGVIGSGLDVVYPPENRQLFREVEKKGTLISEYPPGTKALPYHFPARNRIISGLSLGVAVIEAPIRSGALITVERALEQGKDVFSLPGNVDAKSSEGSNALLREGAIPFMSAKDILSEYSELFPDKIIDASTRQSIIENGNGDVLSNGAYPAGDGIFQSGNEGSEGAVNWDNEIKGIDNSPQVEYIDLENILSKLDGDEKKVAETIGQSLMHVDEIIVKSGLPAQNVLTALTMLEIGGSAICENGKNFRLKNDSGQF